MRKRQTFLLTIISADHGEPSFCGRMKVISTGKTSNFTTIDELNQLIAAEMGEDLSPVSSPLECLHDSEETPRPLL